MIEVRQAIQADVDGIARVCTSGWRDTYADLYSQAYIEDVVQRYYNPERLLREVQNHPDWDGWLVAERDGVLLGAGGGGVTGADSWEIFVLYLDPRFRRQGAGTALLDAMTRQAQAHGAGEQWVSVVKDNAKGLPFYQAQGFTVQAEHTSTFAATDETIRTLRLMRPLPRHLHHHAPLPRTRD